MNSRKSHPVIYHGRSFPSYAAVATHYALRPEVVRKRLRNGQPLEPRRLTRATGHARWSRP